MSGTEVRPWAWGKFDGKRGVSLSLADHGLDVALVFQALCAHRPPPIPLHPIHLERLGLLAFLHDAGKCNWGFQAKADPQARQTAGHVMEAAALLLHPALWELWPASWGHLIEDLCQGFEGGEEDALAMLLAAFSHHGRPIARNDYESHPDRALDRWWRPVKGYDPMQALDALVQAGRAAFPGAFQERARRMAAPPELQYWFAGLLMLADWIGSDTRFYPYPTSGARRPQSLLGAQRALATIGISPPPARPPMPPFEACFGFPPNPLQRALACEIEPCEPTRLLLVESETGSGKTEAALAWFLRLYAQGEVDGLYFALPTRVAARELYARVGKTMEQAFADPALRPGPVLLAVPGYVKIDGEAPLPVPEGLLCEDDARARRLERLWAAEHPKRFLAAPIGVGTIDQVLMSVLMLKHALMRAACLDRHLLVVDEVHASSTYMREVLKTLLAAHRRRGGWALLLSATLGEAARAELFDMPPLPWDAARERPYPAITTRQGERPIAAQGRPKDVAIETLASLDDQALLPLLREALGRGARVLVVCNTVSRAIALQRAIEAEASIPRDGLFCVGGIPCPHHGRYARDDRELMDAQVSRRLGKGSADGPLLLIGTQTLEQSLDIDADLLISDLCPMDVLLQRIGRLHRHVRAHRPAHYQTPRAIVRLPEGGELGRWLDAQGRLRGPAGLGTVYEDGRMLQCTAHRLAQHPTLHLPQDNRALVEATTHPEALDRLGEDWRRHAQEGLGKQLEELRAAETSVLNGQPFGELQYKAPEERITTRLGAAGLEMRLRAPMRSPFGASIAHLPIPAHMLPSMDLMTLPEHIEASATAEGFVFELAGQRFRYTRFGLESDDVRPTA